MFPEGLAQGLAFVLPVSELPHDRCHFLGGICPKYLKAMCYLQNYSNDFNLTSCWGSAASLEAVTLLAGVTQAKVYHSHGEKIR